MLAALLGRRAHPALPPAHAPATDDDFAIALLDAWATVADVLTFYQERIANEALPAHRDRAPLGARAGAR